MQQGPRSMKIGELEVGSDRPPVIVAELSANHSGSLDRALAIVDAAAEAGAHAVKLQTYTADTMTLDIHDGAFFIDDPKSLWKGRSLFDLYQEAHTPWEWHEPIARRCRERGLIWFSTPFDASAVAFLEDLGAPCYKIASFENTDLPLIREVAATGKPLILSTGMATVAELDEAVACAREAGCVDIILLKCTSSYPASPAGSHVRTIPHLRDLLTVQVGLSDHTPGIGAALAAVAMGATLIEKHFTLRRADGGLDAAFSLEPHELQALVTESRRAWEALGSIHYGPTDKEATSMRGRRSLYVAADMAEGDTLTPQNLRSVRPGYGLPPKFIDLLIGCRVRQPVAKGTPMSWDLVLDRDAIATEV